MSSYNPLFAQDQTAWLFEIGQKLRVGYDDIAGACASASHCASQSAWNRRYGDQPTIRQLLSLCWPADEGRGICWSDQQRVPWGSRSRRSAGV